MFPEALMLHYLDDLDSKMESMRAQFERESELETAWTSYNPSLARPLLNTQKFLEKKAAPAQSTATKPEAEDLFSDLGSSPVSAADPEMEEPPAAADESVQSSGLDALQRKFAAHKITPVGAKPE
jgi:3'-5' exoribonuclease